VKIPSLKDLRSLDSLREIAKTVTPELVAKVQEKTVQGNELLTALSAYMDAFDARCEAQDAPLPPPPGSEHDPQFTTQLSQHISDIEELRELENSALERLREAARPMVEEFNRWSRDKVREAT
jgi:hypothetical protein